MSEYPPGSWGYEADRLIAEIDRHLTTAPWWQRNRLRRMKRGIEAKRLEIRASIPRQLEADGLITASQRRAMEQLQDR